MKLVIANKCYSSWSLRPWLLLRAKGLDFIEILVPFHTPDFNVVVRERAGGGGGKVPTLVDRNVVVWESLAIMEYLHDCHPDGGVWPADPAARAHARACANEMHAGFRALRSACPMNFSKLHPARDRGQAVAADVARIAALWREARERFGAKTGGPFLYGEFCAADAMFAPVVARLHGYSIALDPVAEAYAEAVRALPAYAEWRQAGIAERWLVPEDEADEPVAEDFRAIVTTAVKAY